MSTTQPAPDEHMHARHLVELRREANTMALYVAICLLATLTALNDPHDVDVPLVRTIWGITLGLALAHWFAFRVATRLAKAGDFHRTDVELAAAQLGGASGVAMIASIPVLLFSDSHELEATELVLATLVALAGFLAVRGSGASRLKSLLYAVCVVVVAAGIVLAKNALAGH